MSIEAFEQRPGQQPVEPDESVARMVARRPDVDMSPAEELQERSAAREGAVGDSVAAGLAEPHVGRLREVIGEHWNSFRRGMRVRDQPARVEPQRVTLKPGAQPVKARPRVFNPIKAAWLAACMTSFVALGLVFFNAQAIWASAAMATPTKGRISHGERF